MAPVCVIPRPARSVRASVTTVTLVAGWASTAAGAAGAAGAAATFIAALTPGPTAVGIATIADARVRMMPVPVRGTANAWSHGQAGAAEGDQQCDSAGPQTAVGWQMHCSGPFP
jgi:hypothetical protein